MYYVVWLYVQNLRKVYNTDTWRKFTAFKRIWNTINKLQESVLWYDNMYSQTLLQKITWNSDKGPHGWLTDVLT